MFLEKPLKSATQSSLEKSKAVMAVLETRIVQAAVPEKPAAAVAKKAGGAASAGKAGGGTFNIADAFGGSSGIGGLGGGSIGGGGTRAVPGPEAGAGLPVVLLLGVIAYGMIKKRRLTPAQRSA